MKVKNIAKLTMRENKIYSSLVWSSTALFIPMFMQSFNSALKLNKVVGVISTPFEQCKRFGIRNMWAINMKVSVVKHSFCKRLTQLRVRVSYFIHLNFRNGRIQSSRAKLLQETCLTTEIIRIQIIT